MHWSFLKSKKRIWEEEIEKNVKGEDIMEEKWIWVDGFKGMDNNMRCKGFQYEIGNSYVYEGDIKACSRGFHFSKTIKETKRYYNFDIDSSNPNRYFRVKGLVKESNYENYSDKLVAKEIKIISEITVDEYAELAKDYCFMDNKDCYELCSKIGYYPAVKEIYTMKMVNNGFSKTFAMATAELWCDKSKGTKLLRDKMNLMIGLKDEGVSTDMLVYIIFNKG